MRIAVLILFSLHSLAVFAQSKSKQIELVKNQYDSLSLILEDERVVNVKKMTELNDKILSLQGQQILINSTNLNLNDSLNNSIRKLRFAEEELLRISKENEEFISEIKGKQEIIDSLLANSVVKSKYGDAVCQNIGNSEERIEVCLWKKYMSISITSLGLYGRFEGISQKLFKIKEDKYVEIPNSLMFNDPNKELLRVINNKILDDYNNIIKSGGYEENDQCLDMFKNFLLPLLPIESFESFNICFGEDEISFLIDVYILPSRCLPLRLVPISIRIDDIIDYIVLD
jgi:hypothetical protein